MIDLGSVMLAQADQHHLHQAAFHVARKRGVGFDAAADHDVVGLVGEPIEVDRETFARVADHHGLHAGADGAAAKRLSNPVLLDQPALTLGRPAGMAAHRRNKEGLGAQFLEMLGNRLDDQVDVGDAAAAGGDRHGLPGLDLGLQRQLGQLRLDLRGHVGHARPVERLTQTKHLRVLRHC